MDSAGFPNYIKFLFASLSGVAATLCCYPLELLKTRMQVTGEGGIPAEKVTSFMTARKIVKEQGVSGLYQGLSASILRQATYTGVRLGAYQVFYDMVSEPGKPPSFGTKIACGTVSGVMGALAGLPSDVVLTRMAADGHLPPEKRRNYKNVFDGLYRVVTEEKFSTLFRGIFPTVCRAVIVNVTQVMSYGGCKDFLISKDFLDPNSTVLHVVASIFSAFCVTTACLPMDIAKTRIQNMRIVDGKRQYTGILDVWYKVVTKEGPQSLWKGFTPFFIRNGPQSIVMFVVYEKLTYFYRHYVMEDKK